MTISPRMALFATLGVVAIVYFIDSQKAELPKKRAVAAAPKTAPKSTDYDESDYSAHFDSPKPQSPLRNVFNALVKNDGATASSSDSATTAKDTLHVPGPLAGGDPNWIFTGYAVLNGQKSGLLENHSTHQSAFVKEGEIWKTSQIVRISAGSIIFGDLAGGQVPVMRFDPFLASKSETKAGSDQNLKPMDPAALQGPIGMPGIPAATGPQPFPGRRGRGGPVMQMDSGSGFIISGASVSIGN